MKKIINLFLILVFVLFGITSCQNQSNRYYKLTVVDSFSLLRSELENKYEAGAIVGLTLAFRSGPTVGGIIDDKEIEYLGYDETTLDGNYSFIMPNHNATLYITLNGYRYSDCGEGNHKWDNGKEMSVPGGGVELVYTCEYCGKTKTGEVVQQKYVEKLEIGGITSTPIEINNEYNHLTLQYGKSYFLYLNLMDVDVDKLDSFNNNVSITFDEKNSEIKYQTYNGFARYLLYKLTTKELSNDNKATITYSNGCKNIRYEFTYDIVDFDFESNNAYKPTLEEIEIYKEFKEMIDSIEFYSFNSPYQGIGSCGVLEYDNLYQKTYYFTQENDEYIYDTGYLSLLTDSVYYPKKVGLVNQNPISYRGVDIFYDDYSKLKKGSDSSTIGRVDISYSTIDPGCTNPTYPLDNFSYSIVPLNYESKSSHIEKMNKSNLEEGYYFLSKKYSDKFLKYQINDLELNIIMVGKESKSIFAFFNDNTYAYLISYSY